MNTRNTLLALCLSSLFAGCAATDADLGDTAENVGEAVGLSIDSTALATVPAATLPTKRLTASAFSEDAVTSRLVRTSEPLSTVSVLGGREVRESLTWHIERDALTGQVMFLRRVAPGAEVAVTDSQLQTAATQRLSEWGLPSSEILRVLQRRAMRQSEENGVRGAPQLHRYKTFVLRGFNGIPVEGHRAVITHSLDGVLHRALVRWPALAASGHLLRTPLTRAQITSRAAEALASAGETSGRVVLRWKYVSTLNAAGEAVLTLRVGARMDAVAGAETTEEAREIDVDVSATP
jgi:hypothetical protein